MRKDSFEPTIKNEFSEQKEKEEVFHYSPPDYEKLPPKEKLAKLKELRATAKKLSGIITLDKTMRDRYANKAISYDKMIAETEKLLK